ncbi:MAG: hypothetical protein KAH12_04545 [Anaerolineales bacterium]|nr:hypothetical protein [Anaerolineales bacterium]
MNGESVIIKGALNCLGLPKTKVYYLHCTKCMGIFVVLFLLGLVTVSSFAVRNGDFQNSLKFWKYSWNMQFVAGEAVLSDVEDEHAFIFQADSQGTGVFSLSFDFFNGLSTNLPAGRFYDSFYASLYYVDVLSEFITEHDQFDASCGVMDADANGSFNINGNITLSSRGSGWQHFSGTFTNTHTYAVIMFELYDLNAVSGDSTIRIDEVQLTQEDVL